MSRTSPKSGTQQRGTERVRRPPLMMALEPRVMFDGAAASTAHALHPWHPPQHPGSLVGVEFAPRIAERITEPSRTPGETLRAAPVTADSSAVQGPAVVFVDSRVVDAAGLLAGVTPGTEIVTLKPTSNGLQQIASYLSHHHEVSSVEIIAHGSAGELVLGNIDVTAGNVNSFAGTLGEIGRNLRPGVDILVYACDTAATARGVAFVDALARDMGHVVAASSNVTGAGGDWNLEIATGTVTAVPVLAKTSEAHYAYALGTTTVSTAAQLNAAIAADDLDLTGNDTITLTGNITYASALDAAVITHLGTGTLTINGAGYSINAAYLSRVLTVTAGNVVLENITLEHGLLAGAGGALSLSGVSELGAGIYNSGTLTLLNVNVTQNVATAGGGGGGGLVGAGGGGGSGAGGSGGATGGGLSPGSVNGSTGGKGTGSGGGLGGSASGGGAGGSPALGGSAGGMGATTTSAGVTAGGGGGGSGYGTGNGAAGGNAAGGIYNAGTGKLYVLGSSTITNNLGAAGGGGGGIGLSLIGGINVPFHGGAGGQGVGGIWNATTGQVFITGAAYSAMTGNVGADGTIGSAGPTIDGGSNAGITTPAAAANINSGSGTVTKTYVPATPVVSSITTAGSSPNNAASDSFTVTFSEAVTGVNALDFSLTNTGTVAGVITSVTGSGSTYTVVVGPVTGDGTLGLNFAPTTPVYDAAGNLVTSSYSSGQTYTIEHTPPVATSITGPASNPNNLATDIFTVNFSQAVGGVATNDFTLLSTGTVAAGITSVAAVSPDANGRSSSYTVTVGGTGGVGSVTGNGTLELNLNTTGTSITDAAGNALVVGTAGPIYGIEHTAPVVTSIDTVGSTTNNASSEAFVVTFSEAVSTPLSTDFTLTNTGTSAGIITSILPVTSSAGTGGYSSYTVLVSPATGDGTMSLNFYPLPSPVDAAGNAVAGSFTSGETYTLEHTPPVATSIATTGANPNHAGSDSYTVTFSENVGGVVASDFALLTTGSVAGSITSVTAVNSDANGRAKTYTVTVGGVTGNGTLELNLNGSGTGITDAAGNALVVGTVGQAYVIEQTPPVATSITGPSNNPNNLATDTFTVNFSEAVGGVAANDFTLLTTGTVAAGITSVAAVSPDANGRSSSYTVTAGGTGGVGSVTGNGTLELNLNATGTGITDAAGNAILGGAVGPIYGIEHTAPVVTSIDTVGSTTNNASSETFVVTFSEAVSTPLSTDFTLTNTGTSAGVITSILPVTSGAGTGGYSSYTVLVSPATGDGTMSLNFYPAPSPVDAAGNAVASSFTSGETYTVEHTPPVATSIVTASGDSPSAQSEQFTVNFSENVGGVVAGDFTLLTTGTVGGAIASATPVNPVNGRASAYTVTVNGVTGIGTLQVNLNATGTGITDAAGNAIVGGAVGPIYGVTHTLPTVSSIVLDDPATNNLTSEQYTVNFSENVTGVNAADFSLTNSGSVGGVITSVTGSGSSYTVTVSPVVGDGTMRLNLNAVTTIVDATGNTTAGGYTSGPSYNIEHTPPVATSIDTVGVNPNDATTDQYSVTFSEAVGGVTADDFTLATSGTAAGTIASVTPVNAGSNGLATAYTVALSNVSGNGTLQLNLNASGTGITDAAGNAIVGGELGEVYAVGHTEPVVTSIATVGATTNNATSDTFTVTFSEPVSAVSVGAGDFAIAMTGTVLGAITSLTPVNPVNGFASGYTVIVGPVGGTGTLGLNFVSPVVGQPVDAYGNVTSGTFTGSVYTVNQTPPVVTSFTTAAGDGASSTSDQFTVTFSEPVTGVAAANFSLAETGSATGTIGAVTPVNPVNGAASSYTVSVDGIHGTGTIEANLTSGTGITDVAGNVLVTGAVGPVYGVSVTAPSVTSITLVDAPTNNLGSDQFTVNFSENVSGVAPGDFVLTETGNVMGSIASAVAVSPVNGLASAYTVTVDSVAGDGTMRLDLSSTESGITDAQGNAASGGYTGGATYTISHTAPEVTSITLVGAPTNNATTEEFTVNFSENVGGLTTGDFALTDSTGLSGTIASVTAVNPDANGRANSYTVTVTGVSGNGTMRLDVSTAQSGITDAAGNSLSGGYTSGPSYTVNQTAPVVSSIALVDASPNNLASEEFTVNFSESVSGVDAADFALHDTGTVTGSVGSVTAVNAVNGLASSYTVTVTNVTGNGTMRLDLSTLESGITDAAGNTATGGYTGGPPYTIEHTPPTVSSVAAVSVGPSNSSTQVFTVDFSEGVTGVTAADFTAATTGTVGTGSITVAPTSPFASSYTVTVTGVTGNGTLGLNVNSSGTGITDAAGNAILGGFSTGASITIETTPPAVTSIALVNPVTNNLGSEQFTVTFSESVSGVTAGDFLLTNGNTVAGTIASVTAFNPDVLGHSTTYTVTVNNVTGDGTMRLDLAAMESGITDYAGNMASGGYTGGPSYTIEHTPPAVTSIALVDPATNNASSEQFTVNFSEPVGGLTAGDFILTTGGSVAGTIGAITAVDPGSDGRASAYTVTVSNVTGDGTMRLDVSAAQSGITDAAGNAATGAYTAGPSYTIEHTAPGVTSIALVGSASNDNPSEMFTVNFSENVSGVNAGDFVLSNTGSVTGAITGVVAVDPDANGRANSYTVTVTGVSGAGSMRLDLGNSTAGITDAAGNAPRGGFDTGPSYTLGTAVPAVESIAVVGPTISNANSEQFTVQFSEDVSGVGSGDFVLTTTGTAAGTVAAVTGSGPTYTVTVSGVSGDGTLRLDLNGTGPGIVDTADHPLQTGFTGGQVVTLEHTPPSVTAIAALGANPNNAATEQYTVTFSANVSGVTAADFALVNTGSVAGTIASVTGSGDTYTVTVSNVTGDGTMRLDLNAGASIVDAAGNSFAAGYEGPVITLEHSAPTVTSFTPVGTSPNDAASEQYTITFSADVTGVDLGDFTLLHTGTASGRISAVSGSGNTYTVTLSDVSGDGTLQLALNAAAGGITDAAGNSLGGGSSGSDSRSEPPITVQHTPPAVSSIDTVGANPNDAVSERYTVTFSENVSGVSAGDFTLATTGTASGKITSVSGSGDTYVVTVSNVTGDGTMRLDLDATAAGIRDAAGNPVGAGFTAGQTFTVRHSAPVVESVSAPPSNTYTAGESFEFTVTYDEPVVVDTAGGRPSIAVTLGSGGTHAATYVGGSGTNTLTFEYTVGPTDQSPNGITLGTVIALNGATIRDATGNAGELTLANVASDRGVIVGAVPPQLPLPGAGSGGAGTGGTATGGASAPAAYAGYVDGSLYASNELSTARYVPLMAEIDPLATATVPVLTDVGRIVIDQSVQPPLAVTALLEPVNTSFAFSVPIGTFQFDPGAVVAVTARLADGTALPQWLGFDPSIGRFEGTAPKGWSEHLHIIVSARDQNGRDVMLPVEVQFAVPGDPPIARLVPRAHRTHAPQPAGKDSLATQFARHGRVARERELLALATGN